jgi:hypothetical protein
MSELIAGIASGYGTYMTLSGEWPVPVIIFFWAGFLASCSLYFFLLWCSDFGFPNLFEKLDLSGLFSRLRKIFKRFRKG